MSQFGPEVREVDRGQPVATARASAPVQGLARHRTAFALALAAVAACATSGSATTPRSAPMTAQTSRSNKEVVRSVYEIGFNAGDTDVLQRSVAADFVGPSGAVGPAGFGRTLAELRAAFPDIRYTVEDLVEEGDRVAIRWTWTGTHEGRFRGFPATGRKISNSGFAIFQLRDGQIARSWLDTDRLGFLLQIDALPSEIAARLQPGPPKAE